jgi:hypothetical protein
MGTWGTGTFENDTASDWVYELEAAVDAAPVRDALDATLGAAQDYLDADAAVIGLAAAEVVAALNGMARPGIPDGVRDWVGNHPVGPDPDLLATARAAVDAIVSQSELRELWEETDEFAAWQADVADLRSHLGP